MSENSKGKSQEPITPLNGDDVFWLNALYPDAKALFEHKHVSLKESVKDCLVALDANVLLLPFEIGSDQIGAVEKVYNQLAKKSRLIVPGQAAREYYKHKSEKISLIADKIDGFVKKSKAKLVDGGISLLEDDENYKEALKISKEIEGKVKEITKNLEEVYARLKDEIGGDRVSQLYRKILGECIVEVSAETPEQRADITAEVARRARLKIAPGFKDKNKEDGGVGDYLIWKAILQVGAERKAHCIFVTEEAKADWWIKRNGAFQPRPELIDEYHRASGGKSLHLVPLSGLLKAFGTSDDLVKQVQNVEENERNKDASNEAIILSNVDYANLNLRRDFIKKWASRQEADSLSKISIFPNAYDSEKRGAISELSKMVVEKLKKEREAEILERKLNNLEDMFGDDTGYLE